MTTGKEQAQKPAFVITQLEIKYLLTIVLDNHIKSSTGSRYTQRRLGSRETVTMAIQTLDEKKKK